VTERAQTSGSDQAYGGYGRYYAGGILLGRVDRVSGLGSLYVGLGYKGLHSNTGALVTYFPGTELTGIPANTGDKYGPPRIGQTPEATWTNPEPATVALLIAGVLVVRRR
jgi:hypothetical protein